MVIMRKVFDFLLYSNVWIALAALAAYQQSHWVWQQELRWQAYAGFLFWGTLLLYSLHRLIVLRKLRYSQAPHLVSARKWRRTIQIVLGLGLLATPYYYFQLPLRQQALLLLPAALSLGYVLPLFGSGRRLRDLPYLKIFLIAASWTLLTAYIPFAEKDIAFLSFALHLLERFSFIFTIALLFDIRDIYTDESTTVSTLPSQLGLSWSRRLGNIALAIFLICFLLNSNVMCVYSYTQCVAAILSATCTYLLIRLAHPRRSVYFYGLLVDGMIPLQSLLIYLSDWTTG